MAIIESQIDSIATTIRRLQSKLSELNELVVKAKETEIMKGVAITASQKQAMLDKYATLKTELQTIFQQLP